MHVHASTSPLVWTARSIAYRRADRRSAIGDRAAIGRAACVASTARAQRADKVDDAMPVGGCTGGGMGLQ